MKRIFLLFFISALVSSCGQTPVESTDQVITPMQIVVDADVWRVYKVTVDSVEYLVAKTENGISIVRHDKK